MCFGAFFSALHNATNYGEVLSYNYKKNSIDFLPCGVIKTKIYVDVLVVINIFINYFFVVGGLTDCKAKAEKNTACGRRVYGRGILSCDFFAQYSEYTVCFYEFLYVGAFGSYCLCAEKNYGVHKRICRFFLP